MPHYYSDYQSIPADKSGFLKTRMGTYPGSLKPNIGFNVKTYPHTRKELSQDTTNNTFIKLKTVTTD